MTDGILLTQTGDRQVTVKFDEIPKHLHGALVQHITAVTEQLAARVESLVPSKTGKLRGEVGHWVNQHKDRITGVVGFTGDYAKAGALEYGVHGSVKVGAHDMRLAHVFDNALNEPLTVMVDAYSRQVDMAARRFLRDPGTAMHGEILSQIQEAVDETIVAEGA